ncbi:MAG: MerR family transcriptional regulator [Acidobacteria bacterium]|nr:MerR family transcriptional regulator [Acidobacteriota bacterium]
MEKARIYPVKSIPDKLFFKIGEVCDLIDVQPHVLRYWESEFPMLTPQKNRAGQRTYRRKDVEVVFRIKQLLYDEGFTIAGAKKKLASEVRGGAKLKVVTPEILEISAEIKAEPIATQLVTEEPKLLIEELKPIDTKPVSIVATETTSSSLEPSALTKPILSTEQKVALRQIRQDLQGLLTRLSRDAIITAK